MDFNKDIQVGGFIYMDESDNPREDIFNDMCNFVPEKHQKDVVFISTTFKGRNTIAWKYTPEGRKQ